MFDSCFHIKNNSFEHLQKYSKLLKSNNISKAFIYFDNQSKLKDLVEFKKNCDHFNNLIPVAYLTKIDNFKEEINYIRQNNYKFIKIHPRWLQVRISNKKFYEQLFNFLKKTDLTILWCSFDSLEIRSNEIIQINFLSKLFNLAPNNKKIIMHGGGVNILKFYEMFRFIENTYIDLSYTMEHYLETTLKKDMIFLFKNFDKRILLGSDYPSFSLKKFKSSTNVLLKESKINKKKKSNILINNINNLLNDKKL
jgi:predicted TIM-barrel fold metal-dependent hydrolase